MRKWMADRLKRRKKPAESASNEPKTTPLQPAYFDPQPSAAVAAEPEERSEPSQPEAAEASEPQMSGDESAEPQSGPRPVQAQRGPSRGNSQSGRRRRGRGGRGRGRTGAQASPRESAPQPIADAAAPVAQAAPRAAKGTVVLAIGLPGSGKSSWFKRNSITPLSTDMLRTLLFDDATEQRFQDLVFSNLRSMLKARLIARRPVNYVDATNLTPHERQSWIKLANDYGYEVQAVFFDVPLEVCLQRNQKRERVVAEDVMRRMSAKLKPPTFEEGFSKIKVVRLKQKE